MKHVVRYLSIFAILLGTWGCVPKGAKLQKSVTPPDKTLYDRGSDYLKKGQFIKSRLTFQTLINTYSDSEFASNAYFAMADSYYDEGGTENLLNAEEQYNNFIIFFPASPKVPDAIMKKISLNMKMLQTPDRDQTYTLRALKDVKEFLERFPSHSYTPQVKIFENQLEERLALADLWIAEFYAKKNKDEKDPSYVRAVQNRLKPLMENYQDFSKMDKVLFMLADAERRAENPEQEALYLDKIAQGYPDSKYFEPAKQQLLALKKTVPEVDEKLAQINRGKIKEESFNPLRVLTDIAGALGIKQPTDVWNELQKSKDAEKKAEQAAGKGEGSGPQIKAIITRSSSGESSETHEISQESSDSQPQDTPDKKKPVNKNKRQRPE